MNTIKFSWSHGPELIFDIPFPVKKENISKRKTLLLTLKYKNISTTAEISYLKNYSILSEEQFIQQLDNLLPELNEAQSLAQIEEISSSHNCHNAILNAINIILLKRESDIDMTSPIALNGLGINDIKANYPIVKLKIGPKNLVAVAELINQSNSHFRLDANGSMDLLDWSQFFNKVKSVENIQYIEEPLKDLTECVSFLKYSIPIAIDESATIILKNMPDLIKYCRFLVFKPSEISLDQVDQIIALNKDISIVLSCLYEGPWNLPYFWYLHRKYQVKHACGLKPLVNISNNQKYLQINEFSLLSI